MIVIIIAYHKKYFPENLFKCPVVNKDARQNVSTLLEAWLWSTCNIDYMQRRVKDVANFLHSLKTKGLNCSIRNSFRSTLLLFISLDGLEAGKHPLVCRFMKDLHNINPSLLKISEWLSYCPKKYLFWKKI